MLDVVFEIGFIVGLAYLGSKVIFYGVGCLCCTAYGVVSVLGSCVTSCACCAPDRDAHKRVTRAELLIALTGSDAGRMPAVILNCISDLLFQKQTDQA
jgi:hypothetical protein